MFQNAIRLEKTSNSESVSLPVWRLEIFCWGDMNKNLIKGRSLESVWSLVKIKYQFPSIILRWSVSRRSGIQTDLCPFIKVRRSMCPSFIGPRFESIQRCLTQAGPTVPLPSQKLGGARVPSFRRSSLACHKFRYVWHRPGHLCPPPPFSNYGGTCSPPHSRF